MVPTGQQKSKRYDVTGSRVIPEEAEKEFWYDTTCYQDLPGMGGGGFWWKKVGGEMVPAHLCLGKWYDKSQQMVPTGQ